jgi:hypothetical protein
MGFSHFLVLLELCFSLFCSSTARRFSDIFGLAFSGLLLGQWAAPGFLRFGSNIIMCSELFWPCECRGLSQVVGPARMIGFWRMCKPAGNTVGHLVFLTPLERFMAPLAGRDLPGYPAFLSWNDGCQIVWPCWSVTKQSGERRRNDPPLSGHRHSGQIMLERLFLAESRVLCSQAYSNL